MSKVNPEPVHLLSFRSFVNARVEVILGGLSGPQAHCNGGPDGKQMSTSNFAAAEILTKASSENLSIFPLSTSLRRG